MNDNNPAFENETYDVWYNENTAGNETVLIVHAVDRDTGENGHVIYRYVPRDLCTMCHIPYVRLATYHTYDEPRTIRDSMPRTIRTTYDIDCHTGQNGYSHSIEIRDWVTEANDGYLVFDNK